MAIASPFGRLRLAIARPFEKLRLTIASSFGRFWAKSLVLNMADFSKSWKSLQTLWNASKTLLKWILTPCATVCVDFGWIRKGRNLAVFEQEAWAIAHGFEHGRFWEDLEIAPNSLKRFLNPRKMISTSLRDCLCRFRENSQGSKFRRFWAKSL